MTDFSKLGVHSKFISGLKDMKIYESTEIQEAVIPILLKNNTDLVGQAQTGTGKTAAFALPLLHKINPRNKAVQALILCPTRELALQIKKHIFKYTKYSDQIFSEAVYGGAYIGEQIKALLRPTHIVVATPGRLIDLIGKNAVDLSQVKTVVLDEADEMLSLGFKKELNTILTSLPNAENKWLFSATIPPSISQIIKNHLSANAYHVHIKSKSLMNKNIVHKYLVCEEKDKLNIILQFLKTEGKNQGVIFCRTKAVTQKLGKQLLAKNIKADAIHGDLLQKERDKVMRAFNNGNVQILVATDLAARGIDVEGLTYVVHFQLPDKDEYFTHRSGRTARAGKTGLSLCLVNTKEIKQLKYYEKSLKIKFMQIHQVK